LPDVAFFAVLADIEAGAFGFRLRAETDGELDRVGDDRGADHAPDDRDDDRLDLREQQAVLQTSDDAVDVLVSEDAREDRTERASHAVDTEGVQRVIIPKPALQVGDREERNDARQDADQHGGADTHEAGTRRDDNESADNTRAEAEHAHVTARD